MNVYNFTYGGSTDVKEIEVYATDENEAKSKFTAKTGVNDFQFEMLGVCDDFDKAKMESELKARYGDANFENYVLL